MVGHIRQKGAILKAQDHSGGGLHRQIMVGLYLTIQMFSGSISYFKSFVIKDV